MILKTLTLRNFMPYYGSQQIDLSPGKSSNVVVVFGDNMGGKTSLLNGMRWCLYGSAYMRGGEAKPIPLPKLLNVEALRSADYSFEARLAFEKDGVDYELKRSATGKSTSIAPRDDNDFEVRESLLADGTVLGEDARQRIVHECFPEAISRFMLFDGELLQEYEELLEPGSQQGKRIARAIEQALGIPSLEFGRTEAGALKKEFQKLAAKDAEQIKGLEVFAKEAQRLQAELEVHEADRADLAAQEERNRAEIADLDSKLQKVEREREQFSEMEALRARQAALNNRCNQIDTERTEVLRDAWSDLLRPRADRLREQLEADLERHRGFRITLASLEKRREDLMSSLSSDACEACGQALSVESKDRISAELQSVEDQLREMEGPSGDEAELALRIQALRAVVDRRGGDRLRRLEGEKMNLIVQLEGIDTTLGELQHALEQFDSSEDARLRGKRDSLVRHGGGIRSKLEDLEAQIEDKQVKLDRIHSRKKPGSISVRHRRTAAIAEVLEHLESLFNSSLHRLRDALRETVQDEATAAFLAMTTDKTYKGLRINDQYGLSIIDDLGDEVPLRSAGAEQVVALSLIMALNVSRARGAVVMDTPFGRLDPHHRRNILEALPRLARQVVLLVHEGELTRDETPAHLGAALTRSYAIHHHSSFRSELRSEELGVGA